MFWQDEDILANLTSLLKLFSQRCGLQWTHGGEGSECGIFWHCFFSGFQVPKGVFAKVGHSPFLKSPARVGKPTKCLMPCSLFILRMISALLKTAHWPCPLLLLKEMGTDIDFAWSQTQQKQGHIPDWGRKLACSWKQHWFQLSGVPENLPNTQGQQGDTPAFGTTSAQLQSPTQPLGCAILLVKEP